MPLERLSVLAALEKIKFFDPMSNPATLSGLSNIYSGTLLILLVTTTIFLDFMYCMAGRWSTLPQCSLQLFVTFLTTRYGASSYKTKH